MVTGVNNINGHFTSLQLVLKAQTRRKQKVSQIILQLPAASTLPNTISCPPDVEIQDQDQTEISLHFNGHFPGEPGLATVY